ncbi:hypothetical protein [Archangium lansingense]|uniref:Tetratricopeptide repeat protein n=1 Tax=Archangium lansingense TaxID=2995310 RepID=A0ABT3ZY62_9BACT|nr:hypothetical protein [Archangium lansinium]MCY1074016.1 hypothetical protein [Archangium lansinium]
MYLSQQRYEEAMPLAAQALELAPWSIAILDTYAMAAAGLGRCEEALVTEQRALGMLQEHPNAALEKELRERLAVFASTPCVPSLTP